MIVNYYPHHINDYDSHTAHLSLIEDAVYRRLICLYYRTEAPIPSDIKQACRLIRVSTNQERSAVQQVLGEFFQLRANGWINSRCEAELSAMNDKKTKASQSSRKRWSNANAMRTHTEGNAALADRTQTEGNAPNTNTNTNTNLASLVCKNNSPGQAEKIDPITGEVIQLDRLAVRVSA